MNEKYICRLKSIMAFILVFAMVFGIIPCKYLDNKVYAEENSSSYTVNFKYGDKNYQVNLDGINEEQIILTNILTELGIEGTITSASVSQDQGMTITDDYNILVMTKPFGTGWLKVTVDGIEYQIIINSTPDSISVVLNGTLFFDKNGGSGEMVLPDVLGGTSTNRVSVKEYSDYTMPECGFIAPDGYEFDKWEINGINYNPGATYYFGHTTTAKAIWKLRDGVHSITASYDSSEGEVIISPTMAAQGETVTVSVQPIAGKAIDSISYSYGSTLGQELTLKDGETSVYTLLMPDDDVTVGVTFKDDTKDPISYVDENGTSKDCDDYSFVRSNDTTWTGWVVASTDLTIDSRVNVSGTANLILMDGKTLTVTNGIQVGEGSTLNIYSQSENTGALAAGNPQNTYNTGIGGNKSSNNAGTITINGGKITAIGGYDSAGIGGASLAKAGTITIQGKADVTATSGKGAAGIGTAPGGIGGSVTITGNAKVNAIGTEDSSGGGAGIGGGRNGYCDSIIISGGTVTATSSYSSAAIGTSKSGKGGTISITGGNITATGIKGSSVGIGGQCNSVTIGGTAVVTATGNTNNAGIGGFEGDSADILVNIEGGTVKAYSSGNSGAAAIGSGNKAKGKTTINISGGTIEAYGNAVYGVGIGGGNTGSSTEVVNVNITGGDVTATGRTGIGTGNASEADQTITISGGIVKASGDTYNSNNGAAIGQGNNSKSHTVINIIGGKVSADGSGNGIGAGANSNSAPTIKLRWTDENDEYTATNYIGNVTLEKSFKNKADNTEKFLPGDLTDNSILAGKTIVPADTSENAVLMGDISYGKVIPEPRMQTAGQKVTLTVQTINGSELINDSLSVSYTVGSEMHTVELTQDSTDSNKYTFTMPDADVTVNASFISQWQKLQQQIDGDSTSIKLSGDVIAFEGEPAIQVPYGKTFTIDLNGHKIDRNLSYSIPDGYVMYVRGNLTIRDSSSSQTGTITGGNNKGLSGSACYGGGVQVEAQGSLTLESGSISENKSASYGGGVSIGSTSKFIMTGGSIVGNSAGYGAGIVAKDNSTLTISDGTISNNTAGYFGGGIHVMSSAKFTMTGGSITENTAEKGAGGINYASYEKLMISGDANVINNTAGGKANNVYLQSGKVITINSGLTGKIGVTSAVAPALDTPVVISSGLSGKGSISNFISDNANYSLNINDDEEAILTLAEHVHDFTYSSDGAVITATCANDGCSLTNNKATLTIAAPTGSLVYNGSAKAATITGDTSVLGTPTITYKKGNTSLGSSAPKNAGTYTANITLGSGSGAATASVEFTITPKPVTITGLTASNKTYDGTTTAEVSGTATIDGKVDGDDVSIVSGTATFETAGAGTEITVTFSGFSLSGSAASNYSLSGQPASVTADIGKAETSVDAINKTYLYLEGGQDSINISSLLPEDCSNVSYSVGSAGDISYSKAPSVAYGILSYTVAPGTKGLTGAITVTVETDNYMDITITLNIMLADQIPVKLKDGSSVTLNNSTLTYGQKLSTLQFNSAVFVSDEENSKTVDGTLAWVEPDSVPDVGTTSASWRFTPSDSEYTSIDGTVAITVNKAASSISVLPKASAITYGQTLANSTLSSGKAVVGETEIAGTFDWKSRTTKPSVSDSDKTEYTVVFAPTDSDHYENTECKVKLVVNKADIGATDITKPTAKTLTYNGKSQKLINAGLSTVGTMKYAVTKKGAVAPTDESQFTTTIPTATDAGTYYVWYKVVGNENYIDTEPVCVKVTIAEEKKQDEPVKPNEPDTPDTPAKTVDMYRIYNPNSGEHFYTANAAEKDNLVSLGWKYEGIGWKAPEKSDTPVYRLYNPNAGDHHYTTNKAERDNLISIGWKDEGIGWYSDDAKSVAIYRQYNPNAVSGAHNFTSSKGENDWLVSLGWKGEGIGWYGVK